MAGPSAGVPESPATATETQSAAADLREALRRAVGRAEEARRAAASMAVLLDLLRGALLPGARKRARNDGGALTRRGAMLRPKPHSGPCPRTNEYLMKADPVV